MAEESQALMAAFDRFQTFGRPSAAPDCAVTSWTGCFSALPPLGIVLIFRGETLENGLVAFGAIYGFGDVAWTTASSDIDHGRMVPGGYCSVLTL